MKRVRQEYNGKRTSPITFRVPADLVRDMREEAEDSRVSLNTLTNQLLDRYVRRGRHSNKLGLIPMTRPFLKEALRNLTEEEIKQMARNGSKEALKELVLLSKGNFSIGSFISVFNEWLKVSWMAHRYEYNKNGHHYVIHHELGKKWSLYIAELLTAIFNELTNIEPIVDVRDDSVSLSVNRSPLHPIHLQ